MDFGKFLMRQGILLGHFLCDRVQGVERFAAHRGHFVFFYIKLSKTYETTRMHNYKIKLTTQENYKITQNETAWGVN